MGSSSPNRDENKKYWKPPTSYPTIYKLPDWPCFLVDRGITWAAGKWPSEKCPSPPFSRSPWYARPIGSFPQGSRGENLIIWMLHPPSKGIPPKTCLTRYSTSISGYLNHLNPDQRPNQTPWAPELLCQHLEGLEVGAGSWKFSKKFGINDDWLVVEAPIWKICSSKWVHLPPRIAVKIPKNVNESTTC